MTELQLYKFIQENSIQWNWNLNKGKDDVLIFINHWLLEDFTSMISSSIQEEPLKVYLKDIYICVWMKELLEYYDIEITNIFKR